MNLHHILVQQYLLLGDRFCTTHTHFVGLISDRVSGYLMTISQMLTLYIEA